MRAVCASESLKLEIESWKSKQTVSCAFSVLQGEESRGNFFRFWTKTPNIERYEASIAFKCYEKRALPSPEPIAAVFVTESKYGFENFCAWKIWKPKPVIFPDRKRQSLVASDGVNSRQIRVLKESETRLVADRHDCSAESYERFLQQLLFCSRDAKMSLVISPTFQHILRVMNTNIDGKRNIMFAITSIKGIGRRYANLVLKKVSKEPKPKLKSRSSLKAPRKSFIQFFVGRQLEVDKRMWSFLGEILADW